MYRARELFMSIRNGRSVKVGKGDHAIIGSPQILRVRKNGKVSNENSVPISGSVS